ncbi:hypothetical protein EPA93_16120 [Ktedonosporobacter rubrisoli]|uniref:Uncharacterized protein n=1 Tax=Ktedonosporobacter rubrisoli TaxID=2509675 RepID=A0A4P6JQ46_KTERU|nr:hypothetical protein [Ktedonosporobacter rubrisoli]QBD77435.1 hypothetical protein EPA93_16120 [Ktedonosporobacter rubrisoli]
MMVNLVRIRYVTSHFHLLQGLTIVPWGIYYLLGAAFALCWTSPDIVLPLAMLFGGFFLAGSAHLLIANYYRKTLGTVDNPGLRKGRSIEAATKNKLFGLWTAFVILTALVELLAIKEAPVFDPHYASMFLLKLTLTIALGLLCLTLGLHEYIKEGYGYVPTWPLVAYLFCTFEPPAFLRAGATITIANIIIGAIFIIAGLYNHCLLTGTFQRQAEIRE